MSSYLVPIQTAVIAFIILAWVITIPYLIYKYRKQGSLPLFQAVLESSFVFYMIAAFFLTLLPLPSKEFVDALTTPRTQLVPFAFVSDFFKHTVLEIFNPATYVGALKQGVVIQPLFNIVMTIPFGIYLRYYYKKSFKFVLLASLGLSLFYEVTQLSGVYGIYSRSYRLFDVDDLFLNTLGGMIGYAITPFIVVLFPSRSSLEATIKIQAKTPSKVRRLVAFIVDYYLLGMVFSSLSKGSLEGIITSFLASSLLSLVMYKFKGLTVGLWLVRLKVVSTVTDTLSFKQVFKRNFLYYIFVQAGTTLVMNGFDYLNTYAYENIEFMIFYLLIMGVYFAIIAIHFLYISLRRRQQFFYEKASNTQIVSTTN